MIKPYLAFILALMRRGLILTSSTCLETVKIHRAQHVGAACSIDRFCEGLGWQVAVLRISYIILRWIDCAQVMHQK